MEIIFSGLFEDWQRNARELLKKDVAPQDVAWVEESGQQPLFGGASNGEATRGAAKGLASRQRSFVEFHSAEAVC